MEIDRFEHEEGLDGCFRCGYLIACRDGVVCSECGHQYVPSDVVVVRRRSDLLKDAKRRVLGSMAGWFGVWVFYVVGGLGAMWVVEPYMPWEVVFFMVGSLSALIWGSLGLGWVGSRFAPEHHRRVVWLVWLRTLPLVHLSWLSIAGFSLFGALLAVLVRFVGTGGHGRGGAEIVMTGYVLIAFIVWLIGSVMLIAVWGGKLSGLFREYRVERSQPGVGMVWCVALVSWILGCVMGFLGGVLGTGVISTLSSL
jgi:MFS family permease